MPVMVRLNLDVLKFGSERQLRLVASRSKLLSGEVGVDKRGSAVEDGTD